MRRAAAPLATLGILALAACEQGGATGYVELRTVPGTARVPLYLDAEKIEAKQGVTVLRQPVGTSKLQVDGGDGQPLANLALEQGDTLGARHRFLRQERIEIVREGRLHGEPGVPGSAMRSQFNAGNASRRRARANAVSPATLPGSSLASPWA